MSTVKLRHLYECVLTNEHNRPYSYISRECRISFSQNTIQNFNKHNSCTTRFPGFFAKLLILLRQTKKNPCCVVLRFVTVFTKSRFLTIVTATSYTHSLFHYKSAITSVFLFKSSHVVCRTCLWFPNELFRHFSPMPVACSILLLLHCLTPAVVPLPRRLVSRLSFHVRYVPDEVVQEQYFLQHFAFT